MRGRHVGGTSALQCGVVSAHSCCNHVAAVTLSRPRRPHLAIQQTARLPRQLLMWCTACAATPQKSEPEPQSAPAHKLSWQKQPACLGVEACRPFHRKTTSIRSVVSCRHAVRLPTHLGKLAGGVRRHGAVPPLQQRVSAVDAHQAVHSRRQVDDPRRLPARRLGPRRVCELSDGAPAESAAPSASHS